MRLAPPAQQIIIALPSRFSSASSVYPPYYRHRFFLLLPVCDSGYFHVSFGNFAAILPLCVVCKCSLEFSKGSSIILFQIVHTDDFPFRT